jgi:hypothetical protein
MAGKKPLSSAFAHISSKLKTHLANLFDGG